MRSFEIARCRWYNLDLLLQHKLTSTSFHLIKEKKLRKSEKSELLRELKHTLDKIPEAAPTDYNLAAIIFDFMTLLQSTCKETEAENFWGFVEVLMVHSQEFFK